VRIVGDRAVDEDTPRRATRYIQGRLGGESRGAANTESISHLSRLPRR